MYKLCKKLIASILCLSFFSLQMSLAGSFDGTEVLPGVGGGAGADIKQATDGLTGIKGAGSNNATLEFGKDTIIDWGHFNVGNGQTLNFENGTFAVLNNVLSGMSTIAGQITGQQGTIIISNPNGMLMTAGGSINTSGALILTTQDMRNATLTDGKLNINDLLSNSEFKNNTYSIISLNAGKIAGADINIISKGINVINGSDITSSGNIAFTTSDGANFVANHRGATLPSGYSINIANSSLKTKDGTGTITLKADGANLKIQNSTFNAKDTNVSGKNIVIDTKIEKWQNTMYAASKQCERANIPTCFPLSSLDEVVSCRKFSKIIALCERDTEQYLNEYLSKNPINKGDDVLLIIGPEGGFSDKEFLYFKTHNIPRISLGDLILKAETAVITTIGNIVYESIK